MLAGWFVCCFWVCGHVGCMSVVRPGWDEYFLGIAGAVSVRGDCLRRRVGAVLVRDFRIAATGYNGAESGGPSCLAGECPRGSSGVAPGSSYDTGAGACVATHAEANCLLYADFEDARGGVLYVTETPCDGCARLIRSAGVARVVTPLGDFDLAR